MTTDDVTKRIVTQPDSFDLVDTEYLSLRNLVPSQVLLGNSSFNTGSSISAGLPSYVRHRIKAIAGIPAHG